MNRSKALELWEAILQELTSQAPELHQNTDFVSVAKFMFLLGYCGSHKHLIQMIKDEGFDLNKPNLEMLIATIPKLFTHVNESSTLLIEQMRLMGNEYMPGYGEVMFEWFIQAAIDKELKNT